jgi:hypothetical protein
MMRSKRGLKALVLCGLALGAVALGTSAVQAEEGANWKVEGSNVAAPLAPEVVIAEVATEDMALLFKVGTTNVDVLCTGATFIGAELEAGGKVGGNKVKFAGCKTRLNGTVSANCEPRSPGAAKGTLESETLKGLLMLSGGEAIVLFEPVVEPVFLNIEFGALCACGNKFTVTGKNSVKDSNGELEVEKVTHTVEQGPIAELAVGVNPAIVDGAGVLELAGAHQALKWSGVPG